MQIRELYIDGFGIFTDHVLGGLKPGLNILCGRNEAGKSTLLQFIRFTLFGYPHSIEQRLPPVHGGSHGGRIKGVIADNREVIFERSAGYPGDARLFFPNDDAGPADDWQRLLGHGTAGFYNNVYGISLEELVSLASLSDSGVEDKIFSVGLGLAASSLGAMEKELVAGQEEIYKSRGTKQAVPKRKKELDQKKAEIRDIQEHLPRYERLSTDIARLQEDLAAVTADHGREKEIHDRLSDYLKCYDSYVTIRQTEEQLAQLPSGGTYPENGPADMARLEEAEQRLEQQRKERERQQAGYETALAELSPNPDLAAETAAVEYLAANLEKYKSWQEESREEQLSLAALNRSIQDRLRLVHGDWTEKQLLALGGIVRHRDRLQEFRERLDAHKARIAAAEADLAALQKGKIRLDVNAACLLLVLLLWVVSVPFFVETRYWWGGTLVLAGLVLLAGKKWLTTGDPIREAEGRLAAMREEKDKTAAAFRAYLETKLGLDGTLRPAAALETLDRVEQLLADIQARDRRQRRLAEKKAFLDNFSGQVDRVARLTPEAAAAGPADGDKAALAGAVIASHRQAVACGREQADMEKKLADAAAARQAAAQDLAETRANITTLLTAAGAASREEFHRIYRQEEERRAAAEKRARALQTLEQIAGRGTAERVMACLYSAEKQELAAERDRAARALSDLSRRRDDLNREISALETERAGLRSTSDLAAVMTEAESIREELNLCRREWLAAGAARQILDEVKKKYEQDQQPAVIKNSSAYFEKITKGRYPRIHVSLEDREVMVFDGRETKKKIEQLSRGTREQLLISIRLGFIEEFEKTAEPLPLVLDEVLVNFDRRRAAQAARLFCDFARNRQILLFTCHPRTTRLFDGLDVTIHDL